MNTEKKFRLLRPLLNKPYLWHLNRHSVSRGFACGAFWSMWPVAGQTIPALIIAVKTRGNVGIAFAGLWLSNPLTLVPHWWSAYVLGRVLLRTPPVDVNYHAISFKWLMANFWNFYIPVFVGSLIEGAFFAIVGYVLINTLWKRHTRKRWRESRARALRVSLAAPRTSPVDAAPVLTAI